MSEIIKLQAKGFKSFAKPTEIPFGNNFNCIIGPNGSGKSNVVDLICFVLGKSSAKALRAEKSANLIYNGGKKGSPAKEAQASIVFSNKKKTFPIDSKEIKITRKIKSKGTSEYYINDQKYTRQQVVDILRRARIDPDGHNIILQGDIVHFMGMKTEERRELIEEIAGISMYEEKKAQSIKELEKVEGKLSEANIILTEREAYLRELKKERDQALRYNEIQRTIKSNKATYLHLQIKDKKLKLEEVESRYNKQKSIIDGIKQRIEETRKIIQEKQESSTKINKKIEEKGEKEQIELQKDIEGLRTNLLKEENRLETCQTELKRIKQRKLNLEKDKQELEKRITNLQKEKSSLEQSKENLTKKEQTLLAQIKQFKEKHGISDLPTKIEELDNRITNLEQNVSTLQDKKHEIIREHDQLAIKIEHIDNQLQEIKVLEEKNKNKVKELDSLRKEYKQIALNLSKAQNEEAGISAQLGSLRIKYQSRNEELVKCTARNISIKESMGANQAIQKILSQKDNNVFGLVSDLGQVDSKYSLALEVAAGSRTRSIVVNSDLTAAKYIKLIKEQKLGIATFLPLNKIKERKEQDNIDQLKNISGVVDLAVNLVKFDKKFKNVFSYVLGSTVIINNLETARKIGIGRARMVTLDGTLIEPSGAMVGGYRARTQGLGFQEKQLSSNLSSLELEVTKIQTMINDLEKKKLDLENKVYDYKDKKYTLQGEIQKIENNLGITTETKEQREQRAQLLEKQTQVKTQLKEVEQQLTTKLKELNQTKQSKQELNKKLTAIKAPELNEELNKLDSQKQSAKEEIIRLNSEIKNIDIQINSIHLPETNKISQIIKQHSQELEQFEKELQELTESTKVRKLALQEKVKKEKEFHQDFKNLFQKRNKLAEEIKKLENSIIQEDTRLSSSQDRINSVSIEKAKVTSELEGLNAEFEEFKDAKIRIKVTPEQLRAEIREAEQDLVKIGSVNLRALDIYEKVNEEYSKILEKTEKLRLEKDDVLNMMNEIETKKKETFMKTFRVINKNFKEIFSSLSTKGEASLELEDPEEPFEAGVDIRVKLVGNKYLDIKSLSGGEKTLAALSFIFAIQDLDPAPFYLLDEVDAALDKHNSELLSKLIAKYSDKAQYIVISHNDSLISEANLLYGVSMQQGISKVVSLKI